MHKLYFQFELPNIYSYNVDNIFNNDSTIDYTDPTNQENIKKGLILNGYQE